MFLIPGHGYTTERPLLHFAAAVFARHGWDIREVRWPEPPPARDGDDFPAWFERLLAFDPKQVFFAHDHAVWTP